MSLYFLTSINKFRIKIKFLYCIKLKKKQKNFKINSKKDILIDKIPFPLGNIDTKNIIKIKTILIKTILSITMIIKKF